MTHGQMAFVSRTRTFTPGDLERAFGLLFGSLGYPLAHHGGFRRVEGEDLPTYRTMADIGNDGRAIPVVLSYSPYAGVLYYEMDQDYREE